MALSNFSLILHGNLSGCNAASRSDVVTTSMACDHVDVRGDPSSVSETTEAKLCMPHFIFGRLMVMLFNRQCIGSGFWKADGYAIQPPVHRVGIKPEGTS